MSQYFDPRAELDYSQFVEVDPALEKPGYMPGKVVARPGTIDADYPGPNPRPVEGEERARYEAVRARLDRALQACRIVPSMPQLHQTPQMYEASLLKALAGHTTRPMTFSPQIPDADVIASCERRGVMADALREPYRKGELREVRTVDQSGRTITEFIGPKTWMSAYQSPAQASPLYVDDVPQRC